jgi:UDP-GlcNAc:undecaprenyl-phosphate GlcNAc-1-phosphate transferase
MYSLTLLAVSALLFTVILTPLCRAACIRLGWVDRPGPRKVHETPTPRTGGIAILGGYGIAFAVLYYSPLSGAHAIATALPSVWALLPAILVAFATGLLDDVFGLKPWMKLAGQVAAAAFACNANVQIHSVGGYAISNGWWNVPLTVLWLIACSNAFNLIDGLDGLAAGIGIFAAATAFLSSLLSGNYDLALVTAPLLGAFLGFLPYNFNPASIFMGDCGSLTVGFLLGCFAVIWSQKSATLLGMTAPLIAMAIPLLDTALAVMRRFLRRQPLFGADRGHIHHRLLARGFTPRRVAYLFYASAGVIAGLALLLTSATNGIGGIALVAFCCIVWLAIQYLGYEEFDAARRVVFGGMFRHTLNANLTISRLEAAVLGAGTVDECWSALVEASRVLGFSETSLQFKGNHLTTRLDDAAECWDVRVPLNHSGHVYFRVPVHSAQPPQTIGRLVSTLATIFANKLADLPVNAASGTPLDQQLQSLAISTVSAPGLLEGRQPRVVPPILPAAWDRIPDPH